ncbi:M-phase inducer phosphatase-like [Actinia tenebrosa]|uniref:M-phase inducer phosphatase n=1 Tax=Actinia tenebrosa TaxID=6105 RepID=A0A6P8J6H3_ACTTE|nr:M-phase inducer phosphatase-like [Actinia tenebrosa]
MAAFRQRAESFTLEFPNSPMDAVPSAVLSPITELSMNLEHNSISMGRTPKRKLSLCNLGTPSTPNPSPCFLRTLSNESGYCPSSPGWPGCESPTLEILKTTTERKKSFHLNRPCFQRWNSSPAGTENDHISNKENLPINTDESYNQEPGSCEKSKEEFVFTRPRVPSFVRRFSVPNRNGRPCPQRSFSDPTSETIDFPMELLSPSKSNDSQDSACYVDYEGDDGFIDDLVDQDDGKDDNASMPSGMADLLSAPFVPEKNSPELSDCNSIINKLDTPKQLSFNSDVRPRDLFNIAKDKGRHCSSTLLGSDIEKGALRPRSKSFALKRPNPPRDANPMEKKRLRQRCMSLVENNGMFPSPLLNNRPSFKHSPLKKSKSEVFENRPDLSLGNFLGTNKNMVGDFTRPYTLPTLPIGQHQDLKSITPETVARVISGEFEDIEAHIIDCRYPFEYKGGHIKGAINIYRKEDMFEEFLKKPKHSGSKKVILIFHCEFSSKRGPDMSRFLRNRDRDIHGKDYPALYYPELYLIEGGYKAFFNNQKEYCDPQEYVLMLDENHSEDLKLFSKRSKSWSGVHGKKGFRPGLNYR